MMLMMLMTQASDADSGDNAQLQYSLSSQSQLINSHQFSVDRLTGEIRLVSPLDRERAPVIEFSVRRATVVRMSIMTTIITTMA